MYWPEEGSLHELCQGVLLLPPPQVSPAPRNHAHALLLLEEQAQEGRGGG
jgi:hypothetical protein